MTRFILNETPVKDVLQFDTEKKIIFVHIPKTGGSIFENELKLGAGHATLRHYFISKYYSNLMNKQKYNIFIIVRNPYQRLISTYLNLMRSKNDIVVKKELNLLDDTSNFKKFIKSLHKYYNFSYGLNNQHTINHKKYYVDEKNLDYQKRIDTELLNILQKNKLDFLYK